MRIAIDLDGTLADIHKVFLEELEKQEDIVHSFEDLENYYFDEAPFSLKKFHRLARENWKNREIPLTDKEIPTHLEKLSQSHRVDIVTARDDVDRKILRNWLNRKNVKFQDLVVDKEKTHLNYDVLIDDSPSYIGDGMKILLYDRPYNEEAETGENSRRVEDFSEAREHIERKLV